MKPKNLGQRAWIKVGASLFIVGVLLLSLGVKPKLIMQAMTIIIVNDLGMAVADDGKCTLIEAIAAANTNKASGQKNGECPAGTENDVIELAVGSTFSLTTINNNIDGLNGLPSITSQITIEGRGATIERSSLSGMPDFRIFHVAENGNLVLKNTMITNGRTLVGSRDIQHGGSVFNKGTLTVINSTFFGNQTVGAAGEDGSSTGGGGGGGGAGGFGGGIFNDDNGIVTIINSTFSGNQAIGGAGGKGRSNGNELSGNGGDGGGDGGSGGIFPLPGGPGAFGGGGGGGSGNPVAGGTGGPAGFGGGGGGGGGTTTGGSGGGGGSGSFNAGLGGQNDRGGGAGGGGGAGLGGAIFNNGGTLTIENSTFANNSAAGGIGGSGAFGQGNGEDGLGLGGGIYNHLGDATVKNTIVVNSGSSGDCGRGNGVIFSLGYNLIGDSSCSDVFVASGDITETDPLLGPLQNNGGGTPTHALLPRSPAVDAVTDVNNCTVDTDQRGVQRPQGDFCDIGAYEAEAGTITLRKVVVGLPPDSDWRFFLNRNFLESLPPEGGSLTFEATAGPYTLEVLTKAGYDITSQCTGDLTGESSIRFELAANGRIECTFTGTAQSAFIAITKTVIGEPPPNNWEFTLDGDSFASFEPAGGSDTFEVEPGAYTLKEVIKPGYSFAVQCTNGFQGKGGVALALGPGESIHCTFTATRQINSITIVKTVVPAGTAKFAFDGDLGSFVLGDGETYTQGGLVSQIYNVFEARDSFPDSFWSLLSVRCEYREGDSQISFNPEIFETDALFSAGIPFQTGQDLACTFHNERVTYAGPDKDVYYLHLPIVK